MLKYLDRYSGALSILWTAAGYLLLSTIDKWPEGLRNLILGWPQGAVVFFAWLGISLLLAIAGFRRGAQSNRICSWFSTIFTAVLLFYCTEPFHKIIRKTENLFRKDEYANPFHGAPECEIQVAIGGTDDANRFSESVRTFAKNQGIRECRQKRYFQYSGPPRPAFKGAHVAIWWHPEAGTVRISQYDQNYPTNEFAPLANILTQHLRADFPGKVSQSFRVF